MLNDVIVVERHAVVGIERCCAPAYEYRVRRYFLQFGCRFIQLSHVVHALRIVSVLSQLNHPSVRKKTQRWEGSAGSIRLRGYFASYSTSSSAIACGRPVTK